MNAATNIQDGVDAASDFGTVIVSNGLYDVGGAVISGYNLSNRVVITKNVIVRSVSGPVDTVILGKADPITGGNGTNAIRGVYISTGVLQGFTISNGFTMISGNTLHNYSAGGVFMDNGGLVSNCVITMNSAEMWGGRNILLFWR